MPLLAKELFTEIGKKQGGRELAEKLAALAREALKAKATSDKGLTAGEFGTWYFEACWPVYLEARAEAKAKAEAKAAEAKAAADAKKEEAAARAKEEADAAAAAKAAAAAQEEEAAEAARAAAMAAAEAAAQSFAPVAAQAPSAAPAAAVAVPAAMRSPPHASAPSASAADPAGSSGGDAGGVRSVDAARSSVESRRNSKVPAVPAAPDPIGWVAAKGVDGAEARRLVAALAPYAEDAAATGSDSADEWEVYLPQTALTPALRAALPPNAEAVLLATAPRAAAGARGVPIGEVVRWWFESVWPALRGARGRRASGGSEEAEPAGDGRPRSSLEPWLDDEAMGMGEAMMGEVEAIMPMEEEEAMVEARAEPLGLW